MNGGDDYYVILGVRPDDSPATIRKAYRKRALKVHPDRGGDEREFTRLSEAYAVLSDPEKRASYDQRGRTFPEFNDHDPFMMFRTLFEDLFAPSPPSPDDSRLRQVQRPQDIHHTLPLTLRELYHGCSKRLGVRRKRFCNVCQGRGVADTQVDITCMQCNGSGSHMIVDFAAVRRPFCAFCQGAGIKAPLSMLQCEVCCGRRWVDQRAIVTVTIEPGTPDGHQIVCHEQGDDCLLAGYPRGDLVLSVHAGPQDAWRRHGDDLEYVHPLTLSDCVTGLQLNLHHINGDLLPIRYDAVICDPSTRLMIPNQGMPKWGQAEERGTLFLTFRFQFPKQSITHATDVKRLRRLFGTHNTASDDKDDVIIIPLKVFDENESETEHLTRGDRP